MFLTETTDELKIPEKSQQNKVQSIKQSASPLNALYPQVSVIAKDGEINVS